MEQQKFFPTALMGFEKKAVLDYIYEQDMLFKKKEEDWEKQTAEYVEKLENAESAVPAAEQYREQLEAVSASYGEEKEVSADLQTRCNKLESDVEQLVQSIKNKERELQLQLELNNQQKAKCELLEDKLKVLAEHLLAERELTASLPDPSIIPRHPDSVVAFPEELEPVEPVELPEQTAPEEEEPRMYDDLKEEIDDFRQSVSKTLLNFEAALARLETGKADADDSQETPAFFR